LIYLVLYLEIVLVVAISWDVPWDRWRFSA
jgi:hypothetical protein